MDQREPIIFRRPNGGRVKLTLEALTCLDVFRQTGLKDKEAGGVLFGRYVEGTEDVIIDSMSKPTKRDKRRRFSFFRSKSDHQKIIEQRWEESGGTSNYLGEWHSHPEDIPSPSSTDRKDWIRKLREDRFDADFLVFLILGIKQINVWEGGKGTRTLKKLKPEEREKSDGQKNDKESQEQADQIS